MTKTDLRPYQRDAALAVYREWAAGRKKTLLVLPTGTGKTIVFASIIAHCVSLGQRVLVLAHRGELLQQAADKLAASTGLQCAVDKAEETSAGSWYRVTVGSVQTLMREKRLAQIDPGRYQVIVIDEAHHAPADSYRRILEHFPDACVLGVTATPDRADLKDLGEIFDSLAYEYSILDAIRDGWLSPIRALTIPLQLDISQVKISSGDYSPTDLGDTLAPYLEAIADNMVTYCKGRRTVVFLPLIATAQKFRDLLIARGFDAREVNGQSPDRAEILADFAAGKFPILCNAMLLTEGWDCPGVDCIAVLRPTKSRALYCQMVGRGTRIAEGKDHLLLLDFLWLTARHAMMRPAALISDSGEVADAATEAMAGESGISIELTEAVDRAKDDVIAQREAALAAQLEKMRRRKLKLVDPVQYGISINAPDILDYTPVVPADRGEVTDRQKETLEKFGINPDRVDSFGMASALLDRLKARTAAGLATPKMIRCLEQKGFRHVGEWKFTDAKNMISRLDANGWRIPHGINPATYTPAGTEICPEIYPWEEAFGFGD